MDTISILAALDENYLPQLTVMLTSFYLNNPGEKAELYLLYSGISRHGLETAEEKCRQFGMKFYPVRVDGSLFQDAPVTRQYPKEMYYRLLASSLIPERLFILLFLDPD